MLSIGIGPHGKTLHLLFRFDRLRLHLQQVPPPETPLPSQVYCSASGSGPASPCIDLAAAAETRVDLICTVKVAPTHLSRRHPTSRQRQRNAERVLPQPPSLARLVCVSVNETPHVATPATRAHVGEGSLRTLLYSIWSSHAGHAKVLFQRSGCADICCLNQVPVQLSSVLLAAREQRSMQAAAPLHCVGANKVQTLVRRNF